MTGPLNYKYLFRNITGNLYEYVTYGFIIELWLEPS